MLWRTALIIQTGNAPGLWKMKEKKKKYICTFSPNIWAVLSEQWKWKNLEFIKKIVLFSGESLKHGIVVDEMDKICSCMHLSSQQVKQQYTVHSSNIQNRTEKAKTLLLFKSTVVQHWSLKKPKTENSFSDLDCDTTNYSLNLWRKCTASKTKPCWICSRFGKSAFNGKIHLILP